MVPLNNSEKAYFQMYEVEKQTPGLFCEKGILKNFAKFTGKNLR